MTLFPWLTPWATFFRPDGLSPVTICAGASTCISRTAQNARARIFSTIARILPTDGIDSDGFGDCGEPAQRLVEPRCAARGTGAGAGGSAGGDIRSRSDSPLQPG